MTVDKMFVSKCFPGVNPDDYVTDIDKITDYYLKIGRDHECCLSYGICGG